jgi:hypothetical protein
MVVWHRYVVKMAMKISNEWHWPKFARSLWVHTLRHRASPWMRRSEDPAIHQRRFDERAS